MIGLADILKEVIALVRVEVASGKPEAAEALSSYEWLLREMGDAESTLVQEVTDNRFQPGKIHVFKYNPKHADTLEYFDTHPVMLHLGTIRRGQSILELGVNISWYPSAARKFIVEKVREIYDVKYSAAEDAHPGRALDQRKVFLNVYRLRHYLDHLGFSFAIRQYIPQRVVSSRAIIEYGSWDKAVDLTVPGVFPELNGKKSLPTIYQEFFRHLRKVNEDRQGRRDRIAQQRRDQNLYRFIDGNGLS